MKFILVSRLDESQFEWRICRSGASKLINSSSTVHSDLGNLRWQRNSISCGCAARPPARLQPRLRKHKRCAQSQHGLLAKELFRLCRRETLGGVHAATHKPRWCIFQQPFRNLGASIIYLYVARKFRLSRGFQFAPSARAASCFCNFTSCNATAQLCHFICRHHYFEVEVAPECVSQHRGACKLPFCLMRRREETKSNAHSCLYKAPCWQRANLSLDSENRTLRTFQSIKFAF